MGGVCFDKRNLKINNMKAKIKVEKEVDIKILNVYAGVRYWEDATVNGIEDETGELIPCREGDTWILKIDVDTGQILNWTKGTSAEVHYKVCDCCAWTLIGENDHVVASVEDGYVPDTLCPKKNGYGDYIKMDIDENGMIANWKFNIDDFLNEED